MRKIFIVLLPQRIFRQPLKGPTGLPARSISVLQMQRLFLASTITLTAIWEARSRPAVLTGDFPSSSGGTCTSASRARRILTATGPIDRVSFLGGPGLYFAARLD